jgi:hypothetical protein
LFFLWIGFWLSRDLLLQGVQFFGTNWAIFQIKQNLPARSRKRREAPIPRMGKGLPGFGVKRVPSLGGLARWTTRPHRRPWTLVIKATAQHLSRWDMRLVDVKCIILPFYCTCNLLWML